MGARILAAMLLMGLAAAPVRVLAFDEQDYRDSLEQFGKSVARRIEKKDPKLLAELQNAAASSSEPYFFRMLGKLYYANGSLDDAIYCYSVVSVLDPSDKATAAWLISALQGRGAPQLKTAPAIVFKLTGGNALVTNTKVPMGLINFGEKKISKERVMAPPPGSPTPVPSTAYSLYYYEVGLQSLRYVAIFGVEGGKTYGVNLGGDPDQGTVGHYGGYLEAIAGEKFLPPGFVIPK